MNDEKPYLVEVVIEIVIEKVYNPKYGDARVCAGKEQRQNNFYVPIV